jgi:hypothetical protein
VIVLSSGGAAAPTPRAHHEHDRHECGDGENPPATPSTTATVIPPTTGRDCRQSGAAGDGDDRGGCGSEGRGVRAVAAHGSAAAVDVPAAPNTVNWSSTLMPARCCHAARRVAARALHPSPPRRRPDGRRRPCRADMSVRAAIALGAVVGLALGIVVGVTTDVPLAPEVGLVLGALVGWFSRRKGA